MSRAEDLFERNIMALGARLSERTAAALAFVLYAGVGLALPVTFSWPTVFLIYANFLATMLAGFVLLGWLTVQLQARDRRHLLEWTTNLRHLTSEEFEWFVGEVFRREGWAVRETGHQDRADGNIDLELTRDGTRMVAQCKRWVSWFVDVDEIRRFAGTLMREKLHANSGIFVTLSDFTQQARHEASQLGILLVDRHDLHSRVEKLRRVEPCPICQCPMILDRSKQGWWFRCVATRCEGKRDLGREPGAALEFLVRGPVATR
jgi:HJR/Mrr/RecB family endonuclease